LTESLSIQEAGEATARSALERCVQDAGVAIFPADTLYGVGCDPLSVQAIERINAIKGRGEDKPSAVMFFSPLAMRELVSALGPLTREAIGALLPGPVTLVVDNPEHRYPLACRPDPGRLGIRLIEGPLAGANCALFQTSANRSGQAAPSSFDEIDAELIEAVDLAIDGGRLGGVPSTVVDLSKVEAGGAWRILRQGAHTEADLTRRLEAAFQSD
jgi:L-threonylcarbamoyladenylate synthase